jgi:D-methionine transport system ATP-binding protein
MSNEPTPILELQSISYQSILTDITLRIETGSLIAIAGSSGAGKSTLLRLLNRLIDHTSGKIYIAGKDIQTLPISNLRQQVMLVPQESYLLGMNVQEAIAYPLKLRGYAIATIQTRLEEWTERMHLDSKLMQRTEVQLSVGQRQWVALTRALVTEPEILLLDEPTSALDHGRATLLLNLLRELAPKQTVIMVNHQLDLIADWCSDLVQLHKGQLVRHQAAQSVNWQDLETMLRSTLESQDDSDDW